MIFNTLLFADIIIMSKSQYYGKRTHSQSQLTQLSVSNVTGVSFATTPQRARNNPAQFLRELFALLKVRFNLIVKENDLIGEPPNVFFIV